MSDDEIPPTLRQRRVCDLGLAIAPGEGVLGRAVQRLAVELAALGLPGLTPHLYLSDEWGVPDDTIAIAVPFYLAHEELRRLHARRGALVEGSDEEDILRYLRHELGHVIRYAYNLPSREPAWSRLFGAVDRPYLDEFRAVPFDLGYVRHLPGGYAQKHPEEDWAETFAVVITPGLDWRALYAGADAEVARAKLEYCAQTLASLRGLPPELTAVVEDVPVAAIEKTVGEIYDDTELAVPLPRSIDGDLRAIFDGQGERDAAALLESRRVELVVAVYRWTGVDPSLLHRILTGLVARCDALGLVCPAREEASCILEVTAFLTVLASSRADLA